jgi:hypothetical protein
MPGQRWTRGKAAVAVLCGMAATAAAQERPVYKCPGNLYTDTLNAKEAEARGCKALEGGAVTIIQTPAVRRPAVESPRAAADASPASRPAEQRVDPNDQKARDQDKRRILESELRREEQRLVGLRQEYNNGQPERRGDERNYQKYLDRTAELKAGIERSESDIAALKRELSKLPPVN